MADVFFQIDLPVALRRFFSLPMVEKRRHDAHFPAVDALAFVFSRIARTAAPLSPALEDNFLAPRLPVLSVYVDNFANVREVGNAVLRRARLG